MKLAERAEENRQTAEDSTAELRERVTGLQTEQESILHAIGAQIDSACQFLSKDSDAKLQVPTHARTYTAFNHFIHMDVSLQACLILLHK